MHPLEVNRDPEKPKESWRSDDLSFGADSGLEFVISIPLNQLRKKPGCDSKQNTPRGPLRQHATISCEKNRAEEGLKLA